MLSDSGNRPEIPEMTMSSFISQLGIVGTYEEEDDSGAAEEDMVVCRIVVDKDETCQLIKRKK